MIMNTDFPDVCWIWDCIYLIKVSIKEIMKESWQIGVPVTSVDGQFVIGFSQSS
jgi:hypothetical protein